MTTIQTVSLLSAGIAILCATWLLLREKAIIPIVSFGIGLLLFAGELVLGCLALEEVQPDAVLSLYRARLVVLAFAPGIWLTFALTYSRGDYRIFLKRWLPGIAALLVGVPLVALASPALLLHLDEGSLRLGLAGRLVYIAVVLGATAVLMNVERTFRASVGVMRWQLKFMTIGLATLFLTRIYTSTQMLVFSTVHPALDAYNAGALAVCCVLAALSITRSKRFMLDLYPSTTLIHRSLTVVVVGAYLLGVGVLANAVAKIGGVQSFPIHAFVLLLALVLLGLALFSDRVRLGAKSFVGRHLRRPVYDARKIWREFNERTATRTTEEELCRASVRWLSETFETLSVALWLVRRDGASLAFGASTSLDEAAARQFLDQADVAPALKVLKQSGKIVNMDESRDDAISRLRVLHPQKFHNGGQRICVPITSGGELLALMMLGDRVAGATFSVEEMDLIRCVGTQIGEDIVRLRLAEKLVEAKEIQAFQTMATFFVHDLKNTAWTLSLLVENLRKHFDDPAFREEAVKALSTSVGRMNDLIARIGSLREALRLNKEPADLNQMVSRVLKEFSEIKGVQIETDLRAVPAMAADVEQVQSVVRNLVLNAKEAMTNGHGNIRVTTEQQDGFAVLTVRDNGCGMSEEFLKKKLFRPFQTTKNKGIGIGMFQSKTIVEAHDGRMIVDSRQGAGTTIRVMLPTTGKDK